MKIARRAVATLLGLWAFGIAMPSPHADGEAGTHSSDYRIDSEHVDAGPVSIGAIRGLAEGRIEVEERTDGTYRASGTLRGTYFAYKSRLSISAEGTVVERRHRPQRYRAKIVHDSIFAEDESVETTIAFDADGRRAVARSVRVSDDRTRVLYERTVPIDAGVRDLVSGILDVLASDRAGDAQLPTIIDGRPTTYRLRHLGAQSTTVAGARIPCERYELALPGGVIDENPYRFTFWSRPGIGTVVRARIAPGGSSLLATLLRTRWR